MGDNGYRSSTSATFSAKLSNWSWDNRAKGKSDGVTP